VNVRRCSIIAALLLLPLAASAQELTLGVNAGTGYDSNVFANKNNEEDDFSFRIGPHANLEDHEGKLQWDLTLRPAYDYTIDVRERRGWTYLADGELSWQLSPTTRLDVLDRFGRYRSLTTFNEVVTAGEGDEIVDVTQTAFRTERNIRNSVNATLTHNLSPARMLIFDVGHNLVDFSREERADRDTVFVTGRYQQVVTRRNTLGGGASFRRSSYDASTTRRSQSTDFYNVFASWQHQFDDTLSLSAAAGPTWVVGDDQDSSATVLEDRFTYPITAVAGENRLFDASSCPTEDGFLILTTECDTIDESLPFVVYQGEVRTLFDPEVLELWNPNQDLRLEGSIPSTSKNSLTYFANVTLSKRWEQWTGTLTYRRQQSDSSGLGSSTVADVLSGVLNWRPSPRWRFSLRASLTRQNQATEGVQTVVAVRPVDLSTSVPGLVGGFGPAFSDVVQSFALRAIKVDQKAEVVTLWLRFNVRYRITRRTTLVGDIIYWDQNTDSTFGRDYDRFRVNLGVEYRWEPIRL
jgi:hypothetical protein